MTIGSPPMRPKHYADQIIGFRLDSEQRGRLNALASQRGLTVSDLLREIVSEALDSGRVNRTTACMKRTEMGRNRG